ncbi:DgyrCDS14740 [Dimorphilus gyrociliatus]|uniref:DgyrCDS14740 n=1 Tax=Dimorphilus gyrociliatus TaxID=2664684 RepID=A0A7I8WF26_9ANNE|nr:DgyrCDS14740 [Dimorphilus gyrociliatus]
MATESNDKETDELTAGTRDLKLDSVHFKCKIKIPIKLLLHQRSDRTVKSLDIATEDHPNGVFFYPRLVDNVGDTQQTIKLYSDWDKEKGIFHLKTINLNLEKRKITIFPRDFKGNEEKPGLLTYNVSKDGKCDFEKSQLIIEWNQDTSMNATLEEKLDRVRNIRIGTFNIKKGKIEQEISKLIQNFDLLALQELPVSPADYGEILKNLNKQLNEKNQCPYYIIIGGKFHNENSAYLYNTKYFVNICNTDSKDLDCAKTWETEKENHKMLMHQFFRPPLIVSFQTKYCELDTFTFISLHTSPNKKATSNRIEKIFYCYPSTAEEIETLFKLSKDITAKYDDEVHFKNLIIGGDLNWSEQYLLDEPNVPEEFTLRTPKINTNQIKTEIYDRLYIYGTDLEKAIIRNSGTVYYNGYRRKRPLEKTSTVWRKRPLLGENVHWRKRPL